MNREQRRTKNIKLVALTAIAAAVMPIIISCGGKSQPSQALHCVDKDHVVVEEKNCPDKQTNGGSGGSSSTIFPYFWWYGGAPNQAIGTRLSTGSTSPAPNTSYRSASGTSTKVGGNATSGGSISRGGLGGTGGGAGE